MVSTNCQWDLLFRLAPSLPLPSPLSTSPGLGLNGLCPLGWGDTGGAGGRCSLPTDRPGLGTVAASCVHLQPRAYICNSCRLVGGLVGDRPGPDRPRSGCLFVPPPEVQASRLKGKTIGEVFGEEIASRVLCKTLSLASRQAGKAARSSSFVSVRLRKPGRGKGRKQNAWERKTRRKQRQS